MDKSELEIKHEMASRLTLMCAADVNLKSVLLALRVAVNPILAETSAECMLANYGNSQSIEVDFLGILNGLYGDNSYSIVPEFKNQKLIGFKVVKASKALSVNSIKYLGENK